ncbi:MAG: SIR2 family protein [Candidatus Binatia bacterium]
MSKCYILGAGFSKAVSDLPVMKDLTKRFWQIRNREQEQGHRNRVTWGNRIESYLNCLERMFFVEPCIKKGQRYEECNFQENLEAVISFIDLNTSGQITAREINKDGKRIHVSKRTPFSNFPDLDEIRRCIQTYTYLALIKPDVDTQALDPFIQHIAQNDKLITFNYDLIIERALYERGIWKPKDGYGIRFKGFPRLASSQDSKSTLQIYKLHGSLNWEPDLNLQLFYDDHEPIFPGYLQDGSRSSRPEYQGKNHNLWMMPSFMKEFPVPEFLDVWEEAFKALGESEEVVVIGYSLPKEDSAACVLLGTTDISQKRLVLIDPKADELQERYQAITRNKCITKFYSLESFLSS